MGGQALSAPATAECGFQTGNFLTMTCEIIIHSESSVALVGELCVFNAKALKPRLLALLKPAAELEMDLSRVSEVDTAGIQLLFLAKSEAARIACRLNFIRHSDPLLDVISLLNLSQDFGDPLLIPARHASELRHES